VFDKLLLLPLFQGLSHAELEAIVAGTKFGFTKAEPAHYALREGQSCDALWFLIRGKIVAETRANDGSYKIEELLTAPWLIEPERLFGMRQMFGSSYKTTGDNAHFLTLSKTEVLRLQDEHLIFRLNFLNIISTQAQRIRQRQLRQRPSTLREAIIAFISNRCLYPAGEKTIHIKMQTLADELNEQRLLVSRELHALEEEKLITIHRGQIHIPRLENCR